MSSQFLAGKNETYPELPANHFPADVAAEMRTFPEMARRDRDAALFEGLPVLPAPSAPRPAAVKFYSGWLAPPAEGLRRRGWTGFRLPADARGVASHA
jgi:hypothetical protein